MQELLKMMYEIRESAYGAYREVELTADEKGVAHADGMLAGMDIMIELVKERVE